MGVLTRTVACAIMVLSMLVSGCAPDKSLEPQTEVRGRVERPEPAVPLRPEYREDLQSSLVRLDPAGQGLAGWKELQEPVARSLSHVRSKPREDRAAETADGLVTWERLVRTLELLHRILPELDERPELLSELFDWYRLEPDALLTGYYEPVIEASLKQTEEFSFPLYGPPGDLQVADLGAFHPRWSGQRLVYRVGNGRVVPYHSRRDIDLNGALAGQGGEIAWIRDPVDAFFLQIQGSGRLRFRDGTERHVLYSGKNGLQYVSLGRVLQNRGHLSRDEISMDSIRAFLNENPEIRDELLATNPSYVFFRLGDEGPFGAMGRPLTPMTSMATDPKLLPLGSVLVTDATLPSKESAEGDRKVILGLAQDVGGAIKDHHLDLFCGAGEGASFLAGHLQARARVYLLLAREQELSKSP